MPMSDQWRAYSEIIAALDRHDEPCRFVVQTPAGTGKSILLETLYLWCFVHGHKPEACAPTGIAAARIAIPRTPVRAYTLHTLDATGADGKSRVDATKSDAEETQRLRSMTVKFTDEGSMTDGPRRMLVETWAPPLPRYPTSLSHATCTPSKTPDDAVDARTTTGVLTSPCFLT